MFVVVLIKVLPKCGFRPHLWTDIGTVIFHIEYVQLSVAKQNLYIRLFTPYPAHMLLIAVGCYHVDGGAYLFWDPPSGGIQPVRTSSIQLVANV